MQIEKIVEGVYQCVDCGAHAATESDVRHYPKCKPGESARWTAHYNKPDADEWGRDPYENN